MTSLFIAGVAHTHNEQHQYASNCIKGGLTTEYVSGDALAVVNTRPKKRTLKTKKKHNYHENNEANRPHGYTSHSFHFRISDK